MQNYRNGNKLSQIYFVYLHIHIVGTCANDSEAIRQGRNSTAEKHLPQYGKTQNTMRRRHIGRPDN